MEIRDEKLSPYFISPNAKGELRVYKHIPSKVKEKGGTTVAYDRHIGTFVDLWSALGHIVTGKMNDSEETVDLLSYMKELRELRSYMKLYVLDDFDLMRQIIKNMQEDVKYLKSRTVDGKPLIKF